jgi:hypothetical protein
MSRAITRSPSRCVDCSWPLGEQHAPGCRFALLHDEEISMTQPLPKRSSAAYLAGALIYEEGSKIDADLFGRVHFGTKPSVRVANLERDIQSGWLRRLSCGRIALTDRSLQHYEGAQTPPEPKFVGQVAAPRQIDLMNRPPISKRFIPSVRGIRTDIPAWSIKTGAGASCKG